jgi:hypothetical protein
MVYLTQSQQLKITRTAVTNGWMNNNNKYYFKHLRVVENFILTTTTDFLAIKYFRKSILINLCPVIHIHCIHMMSNQTTYIPIPYPFSRA